MLPVSARRLAVWFRRSAGAFVLLLLAACEPKPSFEITDAVIAETPPGRRVAVAYLNLHNHSSESLVLNYVSAERVENIEVHRHIYDNGMMKMREVKHLSVDAGSVLRFSPGGYHLMLLGVAQRFQRGEQVELTFEFQGHPPLTVVAEVRQL